MQAITLCTNSTGNLIGLTGVVAYVDPTSNSIVKTIKLNEIGTIPSELSLCEAMTFNLTLGEFPSRVALVYTDTEVTMAVVAAAGKQ